MPQHNERGIALVLALLLTSTLSVLAASLMFLSQTETYATMNYRMMSQTRYAAEAAVQRAGHFLVDGGQYPLPGTPADPLANYNRNVSPVTYNGLPVRLSAVDAAASNYPSATVRTNFFDAAHGTLTAGSATLNYAAEAELLAMQVFNSYGGTQRVVQTWRITGIGSLAGPREATVEVTATLETLKVPANTYAAFATGATCGAMYFHGNVTVNSYDSSLPTGGSTPTMSNTGGHVGTNGNLTIQGSVDVDGNLYTPRTGVGSCDEGAITALTEIGSADVNGSIVQLPAPVVYPLPVFTVSPPRDVNVSLTSGALAGACATLGLTVANCSVNTATNTISIGGDGNEVTLPNVAVGAGVTVVFKANPGSAQIVNMNSITGSGIIEIAANLTGANNESVVMKIAGKNPDGVSSALADPTDMAVPFNLETMGWKQNSSVGVNKYDASALQIVYPGTGTINMDGGNSQSAATIYAPNANFILKGTQDLYGSVLAKTITNGGNASIHYDRRLSRDFYVAGLPLASTFSWKREN